MAAQHLASHGARVVHSLPGRTRLKLPPSHRAPHIMAETRNVLLGVAGVQRIEINPSTGSLLLHHDPQVTRLDDVARTLEQGAGLVLALTPPRERERVQDEISALAQRVRAAFAAADAGVARATDGWIDLKMLVPVAFLGAAVVQVAVSGGGWTAVPPYVLLYYAFDTFVKFHDLTPLREAAATAGGPGGLAPATEGDAV